MSNPIYLDNAAALPVWPAALETFTQAVTRHYANQEALHGAAASIRQILREAESDILSALNIPSGEADIFWNDSGTSLIASLLRHPRFSQGEIVATGAEHPAMTAALRRLHLPLHQVKLNRGRIDLDHLAQLLNPQTRLVALHHIQSETGIIQDLVAIGALVKARAPQAFLLADTIQSAGKLPLPWQEAGLDAMLISGFKVGAPGGALAVCRKDSAFFKAMLQLRTAEHLISRPLPASCLALATAIKLMQQQREQHYLNAQAMNRAFRAVLSDVFPAQVDFLQPETNTSPYILHFLLPGYQSAVLVRMLSAREIFIAAGSACNAETNEPSPTLLAAGVNKKDAFSGLRISFGPQNTVAEASEAALALKQAVKDY